MTTPTDMTVEELDLVIAALNSMLVTEPHGVFDEEVVDLLIEGKNAVALFKAAIVLAGSLIISDTNGPEDAANILTHIREYLNDWNKENN